MTRQLSWLTGLVLLVLTVGGASAQTLTFVDADGAPAASYIDGDYVYLRFEDATQAGGKGSVYVDLTSANAGDVETLELFETASYSGVFEASIRMRPGPATSQDDILQTQSIPSPFSRDILNADEEFGLATASIGLVGSSTRFTDTNGTTLTAFAEYEEAYVEVVDHLRGTPAVVDAFSLEVYNTAWGPGFGPFVTMTETRADSGVYRGTFTNSGYEGETFEAIHDDAEGGTTSQANFNVQFARFAFVDDDGDPISEILQSSRANLRSFSQMGNLVADLSSQESGDLESVYLMDDFTVPGAAVMTIQLTLDSFGQPDGILQTWEAVGGGADTVTLSYDSGFGISQESVSTIGSRTQLLDAAGRPYSNVADGDVLRVRVEDWNANLSGAVDTTSVLVTSNSGDQENMELRETGFDTGVFEGTLPVSSWQGSSWDDGTLLGMLQDTLAVTHTDALGTTSSSDNGTAIDFGLVFIDENGEPVDEIRYGVMGVRLYDSLGYSATVNVSSLFSGDNEPIVLQDVKPGVLEGLFLVEPGISIYDGRIQTLPENGEPFRDDVLKVSYGPSGQYVATARVPNAQWAFLDAGGREIPFTVIGEDISVRLWAPAANDVNTVDSVQVTVTPLNPGANDQETLTLDETSAKSGVFVGNLPTEWGSDSPGDGVLQIYNQLLVELAFQDSYGVTRSEQHHVKAERMEVLDADGEPTDGYVLGEPIRLRLTAPSQNYEYSYDTLWGQLRTTLGGDDEYLPLSEVGFDTGIFEFSATPVEGPAMPSSGSIEWTDDFGSPYKADLFEIFGYWGTRDATTALVRSKAHFLRADGKEHDTFAIGETLTVEVVDHDPYISPPLMVTVTGPADTEDLYLYPVEPGVYRETINIAMGPPWSYDGTLQVEHGDDIQVAYSNNYGQVHEDAASVVERMILFIDEDGNPTDEILDGGLARVRLYDPLQASPGAGNYISAFMSSLYGQGSTGFYVYETAPMSGIFEGSVQLATPFKIGLSVLNQGPSSYLGDVIQAGYDGPSGELISDFANLVTARVDFLDAYGEPTPVVGGRIYVQVIDHIRNDPAVVDTMTGFALDSLSSGDHEEIALYETGADTGVFIGSIPSFNGAPTSMDGMLTAQVDEFVSAVYTHFSDPASTGASALVQAGPTVTITAPADGSSAVPGNVNFTGTASDPDDGDLTASMTWTSDLDGALGTGGNVVAALTMGVHKITAEAIDSQGIRSEDTITLVVNTAPSVTITAPANGASSTETDPVTFAGTASDAEDGDLSTWISWTSSIDGAIGTGASFNTSTLSVGVHTITADVTDSLAAPASDSITYTVNANTAPTVSITAPANGSSSTETDPVTFVGTASDTEDGDLSASIAWTSSIDGAIGTGASFNTSSLSVGIHTITADVTDSHGAPASDSITYTVNANVAPSVTITAPADGTVVLEGANVTFTGTASDNEDGDLTASIAWTSSINGAIGTGGSVATSTLSIGVHTITADVTDSHGAPASDSITLTVNAAPTVSITAPANGSSSTETDPVTFVGTASDTEDGDLSASIAWTSSIDGSIGTGASFNTSTLSVGIHTITANVTDSQGAPASDSITYTVNANVPPSVAITAPADGSVVLQGTSVTFTGSASDNEDGDLSASILWTSSLDGALGTGASVASSTLSAGTHTITAQVTDSHGAPGSALITLRINAAPTVLITGPADGSKYGTGDTVTFTATASDPENGDLTASVAWSSDLDGALGSGSPLDTSTLSAGTHVITATVTDLDGAPAIDQVTVIVKVPIVVTFTSIDTEDGWALESSETSDVGGTYAVNGNGPTGDKGVRAGDDRKDKQYRGILSFDTSALPANATLRSANLRLRRQSVSGVSPFGTHGTLTADIATGAFGGSTALIESDFEAAASATGVATLSEAVLDGDWSEGLLNSTGLAALNLSGTTQLRVAFSLDDDNNRSDDYVEYYPGDDTDPANHPQLVVEYLD